MARGQTHESSLGKHMKVIYLLVRQPADTNGLASCGPVQVAAMPELTADNGLAENIRKLTTRLALPKLSSETLGVKRVRHGRLLGAGRNGGKGYPVEGMGLDEHRFGGELPPDGGLRRAARGHFGAVLEHRRLDRLRGWCQRWCGWEGGGAETGEAW
eukprot:6200110-Pleurochrysis_carterae.AAC.2